MRFHLLAKPSGSSCNLDCRYCFFLSKEALYPGSSFRMSDRVMEAYVRQLLEAQPEGTVEIAWQGGEPTLMGIPFFERAVALAESLRKPEQTLLHTIQTNGTLIDQAWAEFLGRHRFLVGLSIDGPAEMHDAFRVNKGGTGTHQAVVRAWKLLRANGVEVNILCTIHAANEDHPLEVYRYFRDVLKARYLQFIPIVERATEELLPLANEGWSERPGGARPLYRQEGSLVTERSVRPERFGAFLIAIFDEWVRRDVGKVFVQTFDAALGSWLGQPGLCIFAERCGASVALEHNGDLYACDHYVEPEYRLGNIEEKPLAELVDQRMLRRFGQEKLAGLPRQCRECEVRFACNGECPRNRFARAADGEEGLNYLCAGYRAFFNHVGSPMNIMAELVRAGRPADGVMGR
jgi:uncharacterized protein